MCVAATGAQNFAGEVLGQPGRRSSTHYYDMVEPAAALEALEVELDRLISTNGGHGTTAEAEAIACNAVCTLIKQECDAEVRPLPPTPPCVAAPLPSAMSGTCMLHPCSRPQLLRVLHAWVVPYMVLLLSPVAQLLMQFLQPLTLSRLAAVTAIMLLRCARCALSSQVAAASLHSMLRHTCALCTGCHTLYAEFTQSHDHLAEQRLRPCELHAKVCQLFPHLSPLGRLRPAQSEVSRMQMWHENPPVSVAVDAVV